MAIGIPGGLMAGRLPGVMKYALHLSGSLEPLRWALLAASGVVALGALPAAGLRFQSVSRTEAKTTGRPPEKASTTTRGVESLSEEGTTRRSSWENTAPMSSCHPRNLNGQIAACALYLFEILGAGEQRRPGDNEPAVGDLRGEKPRGRHELHLSLLRLDPADDADVPGFRRVAGPPCPGRLGSPL